MTASRDVNGDLHRLAERVKRLEALARLIRNEMEGDSDWTAEAWADAASNVLIYINSAGIPEREEC